MATYEVVISVDEEPYERILDVKASPSPGRSAKRNGPPSKCYPAEGATPGIRDVKFSKHDPVNPGGDVPESFFSEHDGEIAEQVIAEEAKRERERQYIEPPGV